MKEKMDLKDLKILGTCDKQEILLIMQLHSWLGALLQSGNRQLVIS